jgi:DtxR family Mn-dependent transcriptional regulator
MFAQKSFFPLDNLLALPYITTMDNKEISPSMEDYLERIYVAQQTHGVVRVKDISKLMNVRMPSVNNAITMLKKHNLVTQEPYGYIEITEEGRALAMQILNRHDTLTEFFGLLGVSTETAERDACSVEHVISEETFQKLYAHVKKMKA